MRYALALLARPGSGGSPKGAPPAVPEPAAIAAFGVGAAVIGYVLYRRRK